MRVLQILGMIGGLVSAAAETAGPGPMDLWAAYDSVAGDFREEIMAQGRLGSHEGIVCELPLDSPLIENGRRSTYASAWQSTTAHFGVVSVADESSSNRKVFLPFLTVARNGVVIACL